MEPVLQAPISQRQPTDKVWTARHQLTRPPSRFKPISPLGDWGRLPRRPYAATRMAALPGAGASPPVGEL
ncbi:MAG: hypothetical protein MI923_10845 [Phycisphaerales bacterium]|nr:hypothetical protein [Phycisphaerales bacterium]